MRQLAYIVIVLTTLALGCWSEAVCSQARQCQPAGVVAEVDDQRSPAAGLLVDGEQAMSVSAPRTLPTASHSGKGGKSLSAAAPFPGRVTQSHGFAMSGPASPGHAHAGNAYYVIALRHIIR